MNFKAPVYRCVAELHRKGRMAQKTVRSRVLVETPKKKKPIYLRIRGKEVAR